MVTVAAFNQAQARRMPEKELQRHVDTLSLGLVKLGRCLYHHTHRAEHSSAGVPDCQWVNPRRHGAASMMYAELKRECICKPERAPCPNHPSPDQEKWMAALTAAGFTVYLWRPSDWFSDVIRRTVLDFVV